ncbi:protein SMAX1-LIKE 3-like [Phragmites australis]|uniref:protein SMAX1-LIKE 3-like n=1 Tax=Phragmites australis TaxID=29695 RepID=UPI002D781A6B|nr:protein SMAX1-LIKE 3-like [Phragmites australis]
MRAGGYTMHQALTPEAAAVVKQAVSLARRRGNAQVTPLHVASAMLQQQQQAAAAPTSGLLRASCLRSHSHPLQCKALELCFNVALNRLPASSASPLLGGHSHVYYPPYLSNALVAAFKRAQAYQRRGSVDTQQQPVLAVKIELEQLVISILDDPSVSRVMREAGFSSTQVKANVENSVSSIEANNSACTTAAATAPQNPNPSAAPDEETKPIKLLLPLDQVHDEDVAAILDGMATRRKRRVMVVAECAATAEAVRWAAVEKIKRGEALRGAQVVSLSLFRFRDLPRDGAEWRLAELRCAVKASGGRAGGVVLVVEDLGWAAEFWARRAEEGRGRWPSSCSYYCAVEHAVAEVRALACLNGDGVWLVGHGTYQSYMKCRAGNPSLEILWELQTLAVPAGSLALSLNCAEDSAMAVNHRSIRAKCDDGSGNGSVSRCLSLLDAGGSGQLTAVSTCYGDCSTTNCDAAKALARSVVPLSSIPPWLQHCRDQEPSHCEKWSSTCGGSPSNRTTLNFSTVVSPSTSVSSYEQHYHLHQPYQPWLAADAYEAKHPWKARCGGQIHAVDDENVKFVSAIKVKSHDSSASNGSVEVECRSRFKELSTENHKVLCSALEKKVPWQAEIVPEIASTVLRCRSGMSRRRETDTTRLASAKEDTWMFFLGGDADGKVRVARELASLIFGSRKSFVSFGATAASPARSDSNEQQHRTKRPQLSMEASNHGCLERLYEAVRDNPHRVILVEDVEQADRRCQMGIKEAVEIGVVRSHGGDEAALGDAIVVLSCESFDSRSRNSSPPPAKKAKTEGEEEPRDEEGTGNHHKEAIAAEAPVSSCFDLNMSVEDGHVEESCFTDAGLLKAVDRAFFFRRPDEICD